MRRVLYILSAVIVAIACVHWFNTRYHDSVMKKPAMYCYDVLRGSKALAPTILLEDTSHKDDYLDYYAAIENGEEPYLPDEIPLKGLPQYDKVYVIGYSKDQQLAEVVSYYDRSDVGGGGYTRGWVYAKCIHRTPPPRTNGE